jgi:hypothetical protein
MRAVEVEFDTFLASNADPPLPDGRQHVICYRHDLVRTIQTGSGPVIVFASQEGGANSTPMSRFQC